MGVVGVGGFFGRRSGWGRVATCCYLSGWDSVVVLVSVAAEVGLWLRWESDGIFGRIVTDSIRQLR